MSQRSTQEILSNYSSICSKVGDLVFKREKLVADVAAVDGAIDGLRKEKDALEAEFAAVQATPPAEVAPTPAPAPANG